MDIYIYTYIYIYIYLYTVLTLYSIPSIPPKRHFGLDLFIWGLLRVLDGIGLFHSWGIEYLRNSDGIQWNSSGCFGFCKLHLSRPQHFAFGDMVGLGMAIAEPVQCQAPSKFDPSLCGHLEEHNGTHTNMHKKSTPCWADAACSACLWNCCSSRFFIFADGIRWGAQ